jgi:hypothetical protein
MTTASNNTGRIVWHELVTPDPKAALGFYGELFGWTATEMDMGAMGTYTLFKAGDIQVGGAVAPPPGKNVPPSWLGYCSVPDVEAAIATATKLGGSAMSPVIEIPNVGRFAVVLDAQGAALAPMTPARDDAEREGPPPVGTFCWDELHTKDPAAAVKFYSAIYGYTVEDKDMGPMGTYHILKRGERQAGGIMKARMAEQPSAWLHYVVVPDVDQGAKRAEGLGGKVIVPAMDIPGIGRFSVVADRQGATLALFKGAEGAKM